MNDAKIELTDKQIMSTMLTAEQDLSKDLAKEVDSWKQSCMELEEEIKKIRIENHHLRQLLRAYI